jgi:hypothetical protein
MDDSVLWPFRCQLYQTASGPIQTYACDADGRIDAVKRMTDRATLDAALAVPGLQKTVHAAIVRRIKQLERA